MKKNLRYIIFPCFIYCIVFPGTLKAQDSLSVHGLLQRIQDRQINQDAFFSPGIFPSYVSNKKTYSEKRKDNTIFYTALIAYTLKTLRPWLSTSDQVIVDSIIARSVKPAARFKNSKGRESYNFWRTDSAYSLPYLRWPRVKKKGLLDDDQDCTAMYLLSCEAAAIIAENTHAAMEDYTNESAAPTPTSLKRYRNYAAYSTWMGNRLPPVFDICVLSNILSFVQAYDLCWTKTDSASLDIIIATINHNDHIAHPIIVSPYYGRTSIILYHLARLMSIKPIAPLESMKDKLANVATNLLLQTDNDLEKIILCNALFKWGINPPIVNIRLSRIGKNDFPFFIGNLPSIFDISLKKPLSKKAIGFYYHYCPAYNDALLLEYLVLKNIYTTNFAMEKFPTKAAKIHEE